jgi:hypothetical protein
VRVVRLPDDIEQLLLDGHVLRACNAIRIRFGFADSDARVYVNRWLRGRAIAGEFWPGDGEAGAGDGYA